MKALEILNKCKDKIKKMTQEEFDIIMSERELDKVDYNYEQYLSDDFEIILPGESCISRSELVKDVVEYAIRNSSVNEYKNIYNSYRRILEETININVVYKQSQPCREFSSNEYVSFQNCIDNKDFIYTDEEIMTFDNVYESNPPYREFNWNEMEQSDSLVKAA